MSAPPTIILIGPMGSGKSAVGRRLAKQLGMTFCDSDEQIEERTGVDIAYIFEKEGEAGFRRRESAILAELLQQPGMVLATGGGAAIDPENRSLMAASGTVVYLYTSVAEQMKRTSKSRHRPLLNVDKPDAVLEQLMMTRDPQYREIADIVVSTDKRQVTSVTRELRQKLLDAEHGGVPST